MPAPDLVPSCVQPISVSCRPTQPCDNDQRKECCSCPSGEIGFGDEGRRSVGNDRMHRGRRVNGVEEEKGVGDSCLRIRRAVRIEETGQAEISVVTGAIDRGGREPKGARVREDLFDQRFDVEFEEGRDRFCIQCRAEPIVEVESERRDGVAFGRGEQLSAARRERKTSVSATDSMSFVVLGSP